ncbi:MAG: polysaccharide biosynthesis protein, partial [Candidatus Acidiferrales bacterium]
GRSEREVGITFTGLREGEKLIEELFYETEEIHPTPFEKIKRTRSPLDSWSKLQRRLAELKASMTVDGPEPVRRKMREIVPEYSYQTNGLPIATRPNRGQQSVPVRLAVQSLPR